MAGGYHYLWSEVLEADGFEEVVILDKQLAARYRQMLTNGDSKSGMKPFLEFRRLRSDIN
jgi:Zn-dependent oligopeptidase